MRSLHQCHATRYFGLVFVALLFIPLSSIDAAEGSLSVTVTPPLFQLTIGPGETWTSTIKIVNNNAYDVAYVAMPMDFEGEGEAGKGTFIPLVTSRDAPGTPGQTLGHWIEISSDPIVIPKGTSREIEFTVRVPQSAEPGGHYAAILVGTKPEGEDLPGSMMKISSYVSSLLFVRIKGDVNEQARIREFRSEKTLYQTPKADFLLRFENTGNTHLRPQGDITLYNMWGKERGKVSLNQGGNFGNVLPDSIRKFEFSWQGEQSGLDIGRYSAVVTLSFGQDNKQNITAKTYFWVVPVLPVAATIGGVLCFLLVLAWLIRRYIRRALMLEKQRTGMAMHASVSEARSLSETFIEPLKEGVVDLRNMRRAKPPREIAVSPTPPLTRLGRVSAELSVFEFFQKYALFFFFLMILAAGGMGVWSYFSNVLLPERAYEISEVTSESEDPKIEFEVE